MDIDFVITWVDGNDPLWLEEYYKYNNNNLDSRKERFRDYGILKYWFRAVEKYAPWVRKIHFVTYGHIPKWLNCNNEKINIVKHDEFIPKKYLPTFSSHTIELNMHLINGLSENFVYFNDDMFINNSISETDFFVDGKICDYFKFIMFTANDNVFSHYLLNNNYIINKNFSIKDIKLKKIISKKYKLKVNFLNILFSRGRYIPFFENLHLPQAYKKNTFYEIWDKEYDILDKTCSNKFRALSDISPYLMREWQLLKEDIEIFDIKSRGKVLYLGIKNRELEKVLNSKNKFICINDISCAENDFYKYKQEIGKIFSEKYCIKSKFEI